MYKTLGFKWLRECFCPASAFATADRDGARNPQHFIHVAVVRHFPITHRKTTRKYTDQHEFNRIENNHIERKIKNAKTLFHD